MAKARTTPKASAKVVCQYCGKHLTKAGSQAATAGHLCSKLAANGYTAAKLAQHRLAQTVTTIPAGYIKLAQLHKIVQANKAKIAGLNIAKMVRVIGGDRALSTPAHPICTPLYTANGHRWVNPWLATQAGLQAIATGNFAKAPTTAASSQGS